MFPSPLTNPWLRLAVRVSIALVASLAVAAIAAHSAAASPSLLQTPGLTPPSAAFEEEEAEAESETEDWTEEEEWEEEEEAEPLPADECPLRSAHAHASTKRDKLKLTIGYTTNQPFSARITIQRGSIQMVSVQRHLAHSGVLRFAEKLNERGGRKIVATIAASDRSAGCPSRRLVLFPR